MTVSTRIGLRLKDLCLNERMNPTVLSSKFAKLSALSCLLAASTASAQDACCFTPQYRLQSQTIMQPELVERTRLTYETQYVEEEVKSYRPVLKTRVEEREITVPETVTETSFREERYTIYKPVTETSYREETVTQTRYVNETAEREERVTTYRPVTETQMYQKQYQVQRPVTETQMVQKQYMVQRPVTETQLQTQQVTSYRPVTTVQQQTVDAGGYVPQTTVTPSQLQYGLGWNPRAYYQPGPLGLLAYPRGAATAVPVVTPPQVQTQMVYRPNYVNQQIAQTQYVPEVQQVQRPIQVTRMQSEMVTQNVPVTVQRMQTEVVTQNVPVQTTKMVPQTTVRKVPYIMQRPVTETSTRKVPVQSKRWVAEEVVRKVPVQTNRVVYKTRREPITVKYYEQEEVVHRPVSVPRYQKYQVQQMVPRTVVERVPLSYADPFSPAITSGYSSFHPIVDSVPYSSSYPSSSIITEPGSVISSRPILESEETELEAPYQSDESEPKSTMGKVEFGAPEPDSNSDLPDSDLPDNYDHLFDPQDSDEVEQPELGDREANWKRRGTYGQPASIRNISHRVRWNPTYAREL